MFSNWSMHMIVVNWEEFCLLSISACCEFCFWFSVLNFRKQVATASYSRATEGGDCTKKHSYDWSHWLWKDRDCQAPCQDCICTFCEGMFLLFGFVVLLERRGSCQSSLSSFSRCMCQSFGMILSVYYKPDPSALRR